MVTAASLMTHARYVLKIALQACKEPRQSYVCIEAQGPMPDKECLCQIQHLQCYS